MLSYQYHILYVNTTTIATYLQQITDTTHVSEVFSGKRGSSNNSWSDTWTLWQFVMVYLLSVNLSVQEFKWAYDDPSLETTVPGHSLGLLHFWWYKNPNPLSPCLIYMQYILEIQNAYVKAYKQHVILKVFILVISMNTLGNILSRNAVLTWLRFQTPHKSFQ